MEIKYKAIGKSGNEVKNEKLAVCFLATATVVVNDITISLEKTVENKTVDIIDEFEKAIEKQLEKVEGVYVTDALDDKFLYDEFSQFRGKCLIVPAIKSVKNMVTESKVTLDNGSIVLVSRYKHNGSVCLSIKEDVTYEKVRSTGLKKYSTRSSIRNFYYIKDGLLKHHITIIL